MTVKKSTLALATALAACFVGCEWTGSDESDSWSSAYDAMNFSGTYRAVTTATALESKTTEETTPKTTDANAFTTLEEVGGTFVSGRTTASGRVSKGNLVPGSVQVSAGNYIWNDNGKGGLVFGGGSAGSSGVSSVENGEKSLGKTSASTYTYNGTLDANLVPGSVVVKIGTITAFQDVGDGTLKASGFSGSGTVNYKSGVIQFSFTSAPPANQDIVVQYQYNKVEGQEQAGDSGSGAVLYSSGSWSLEINKPFITGNPTIKVRYSYYLENSSSAGTTTINTTTGTEVSALTVAQNGQNLTITLNNGIVMKGKFTNVQQTGKVNQDTNAGYNTYNAQFQVQTTDNKFVGSLNYDLSNGYRMLNGTWTWGKSSYDVQAVGPAWLNSADASTLSPGVVTK